MRIPVLLTLLAGLAAPAHAQDATTRIRTVVRELVDRAERASAAVQRQRSEEVERTTRTLRLGPAGELHLANISGDISISRGSGNDAQVEIVKTAHGRSSEEAREFLRLVEIDVVERANRAEVRTRYPQGEESRRNNRRNINVSVAFNVTVPQGTRVRANSISGSVTARDVKGEVTVESVSGTVRVANAGRVASAKSISGNVEVTESTLDGVLAASSVSGSVVLRRVKAGQLDLGSISGDVVLDDVDCPRVEAQTVSGNVRFSGPLARSGRYELSSHSGNVELMVAGGAGFEVEGSSFSGSVRSDFPVTASSPDSDRGRRRQRSLRGVVGDGSAVLELTTFSGNIVVSKR